jgi:hypothetical protein
MKCISRSLNISAMSKVTMVHDQHDFLPEIPFCRLYALCTVNSHGGYTEVQVHLLKGTSPLAIRTRKSKYAQYM